MIRRTLGAVLTIAGGFFTYLFATRSMYHGRGELGSVYDPAAPFLSLGSDYPVDVFLLLGASWAFLIGLSLIVTGESRDPAKGPRGGRVARVMLVNALLLVSTLFVGYIGARAGGAEQTQTLAVFGLIALAQVALGLILIVLALFERPKGILSLPIGVAIYLVGVGVGLLAFFWGGAGA